MSRGRRYEGEQKLNLKKVFAVIIAIAVIIMFVIGIKKLMKPTEEAEVKHVPLKYFSVYTDNKWGVIDSKGNIIISPNYDETIIIPDDTKPVFIATYDVDYEKGTYKTKILNKKNEELFTQYELVEAIENYDNDNILWYEKDVLKVKKDGKYGLIDLKGTQITDCEYDSITALKGITNSLITVKDKKQGLIDNTGAVVIENKYKTIKALSDKYEHGYIIQEDSGKYGVVNWNKTIAVEPKYEQVKPVYGNGEYYIVKENSKWKIVDTEGQEYLNGTYTDIKSVNSEFAIVKKGNNYGVVSITDGKSVIDIKYEDITLATGNNYIVKKSNKYGIIDIEETTLVDFKYSNIIYREEAKFYEATNSDYTEDLIDTDMNVKLTGIISELNISEGYMKVRVGEEYKYYNFKFEEKTNKEVLKNNTIFLDKKEGKYGYVNKDDVVVVDYIYDDANEQNKYGYASVKKDGLWGCVNEKGEVTVAPSYSFENNILIEFIGKWHLGEDLNLNYFIDR